MSIYTYASMIRDSTGKTGESVPLTVAAGGNLTVDAIIIDQAGTVFDISGYTVTFQIYNSLSRGAAAIASKAMTLQADTDNYGFCTVALTTTQTNQTAGQYYYTIKLVAAGGNIYYTKMGAFTIT